MPYRPINQSTPCPDVSDGTAVPCEGAVGGGPWVGLWEGFVAFGVGRVVVLGVGRVVGVLDVGWVVGVVGGGVGCSSPQATS